MSVTTYKAVKVKPLVFNKRGAEWWASSSIGIYVVAQGLHDFPDAWGVWRPESDTEDGPDFMCSDDREAMARAQKDHEARILAALE